MPVSKVNKNHLPSLSWEQAERAQHKTHVIAELCEKVVQQQGIMAVFFCAQGKPSLMLQLERCRAELSAPIDQLIKDLSGLTRSSVLARRSTVCLNLSSLAMALSRICDIRRNLYGQEDRRVASLLSLGEAIGGCAFPIHMYCDKKWHDANLLKVFVSGQKDILLQLQKAFKALRAQHNILDSEWQDRLNFLDPKAGLDYLCHAVDAVEINSRILLTLLHHQSLGGNQNSDPNRAGVLFVKNLVSFLEHQIDIFMQSAQKDDHYEMSTNGLKKWRNEHVDLLKNLKEQSFELLESLLVASDGFSDLTQEFGAVIEALGALQKSASMQLELSSPKNSSHTSAKLEAPRLLKQPILPSTLGSSLSLMNLSDDEDTDSDVENKSLFVQTTSASHQKKELLSKLLEAPIFKLTSFFINPSNGYYSESMFAVITKEVKKAHLHLEKLEKIQKGTQYSEFEKSLVASKIQTIRHTLNQVFDLPTLRLDLIKQQAFPKAAGWSELLVHEAIQKVSLKVPVELKEGWMYELQIQPSPLSSGVIPKPAWLHVHTTTPCLNDGKYLSVPQLLAWLRSNPKQIVAAHLKSDFFRKKGANWAQQTQIYQGYEAVVKRSPVDEEFLALCERWSSGAFAKTRSLAKKNA